MLDVSAANPLAEWVVLHHLERQYGGVVAQLVAEYCSAGEFEPTCGGWVAADGIGGFCDISDLDMEGFFSSRWVWQVGNVVNDEHMTPWLMRQVNLRRKRLRVERFGIIDVADSGDSDDPDDPDDCEDDSDGETSSASAAAAGELASTRGDHPIADMPSNPILPIVDSDSHDEFEDSDITDGIAAVADLDEFSSECSSTGDGPAGESSEGAEIFIEQITDYGSFSDSPDVE